VDARPEKRSRFGDRGWVAGAAVVVALGVSLSVVAARAVARSEERGSQRAFVDSATDIAATLNLAVEHEEDLVISTNAFLIANPHMSNAKFDKWVRDDRVVERYPELIGLSRIAIVPAAKLPAFVAHAEKDPAGALAADGSFQLIPPGTRPYYCLVELSSKTIRDPHQPAGLDFCANGEAALVVSRDSGRGSFEPFMLGKEKLLGVQTPLYRGGVVPATVAERRAAYVGSTTLGLEPGVLLATALKGHRGTTVTMRYLLAAQPVVFSSGKAPDRARSVAIHLNDGWIIHAFAAKSRSGILSNDNALALLVGGTLVSTLLGLLGAVLATGRRRALRLVSEQTVELRDQAGELRATVGELQAAQAIKDEFLALVSHELRTPLTAIRGYTELLRDEELPDTHRMYADVIDRNSGRLLGLVEDLLLMAQIQSGGLPLELGEVILNDLIASSGDTAKPFAESKEIDIEIDTEPNVATRGDSTRLGQVLDNLLSNAIKYTPNGGGVAITMTRDGDTATIAVSDTGMGIPEAEQEKMFGRFFRTSNARISGIEGTGLGLAITRGIVEAHGGTIDFESIEGSGTTFRIALPHSHVGSRKVAA
jgi:signal transduction histidine kinase